MYKIKYLRKSREDILKFIDSYKKASLDLFTNDGMKNPSILWRQESHPLLKWVQTPTLQLDCNKKSCKNRLNCKKCVAEMIKFYHVREIK